MREHLYRGKRIDNGEWVYGDLLQPTELCNIYEISDKNSFDGTRYEVEPSTVGQYTGLKDKNGKQIFEGDIVLIGERRRPVEIVFKNGRFGNLCNDTCITVQYKNPEVIGNIFDKEGNDESI